MAKQAGCQLHRLLEQRHTSGSGKVGREQTPSRNPWVRASILLQLQMRMAAQRVIRTHP